MGGGKGQGSFNQSSQFTPPPWALAGGQQAVQTAQQLAQTPFEIPVQPIAGMSPQQQEAFQETENIQGMAQPYFNAGSALTAQGAFPNIGQYFGAESSGVVPELENIFGQQTAQQEGQLTQQAGGIGADRVGVGLANLANQQGLSAGQTLSQIMGQSVGQALQGGQQQIQAGEGIAAMGPAAQGAALQGATAELQAGTLQQQQAQNQINSQYENMLQQVSWPFQTNQYLGSMAAGVTPAMGGTGITSGNVKSSMANTSGGKGGLSALGSMGKGSGGAIPYEEDGEIKYAEGGAVAETPFEIPMPMQHGGPGEGQPWHGSGDNLGWSSQTFPTSQPGVPQYPVREGESWPGQNWGWTQPAGQGQVLQGGPAASAGQSQQASAPAAMTGQGAPSGAGSAPSFSNPLMGLFGGSGTGGKGMFAEGGSVGRTHLKGGGDAPPPMNESPAAGSWAVVPWGPGEGGPKGLFLPDASTFQENPAASPEFPSGTGGTSAVPPPPLIHAFDPIQMPSYSDISPGLKMNTTPGLGGSGQPAGSNPFEGFLSHLMDERQGLLSKLPGPGSGMPGAGGFPGAIGKIAGATTGVTGAAGAGAGAGKQGGGEVGGEDASPFAVPSTTPTLGVSNLLGGSQAGVPSIGGKSIIPVGPVQGRPSPQMQELMKYKGPKPESLTQGAGGQGGGGGGKGGDAGLKNLMSQLTGQGQYSSQKEPSQPGEGSITSPPGYGLSMPGTGGKGPIEPLPPDEGPQAMMDAGPTAFDMGAGDMTSIAGDMGGAGKGMMAATGGRIHYDTGGNDPADLNYGLASTTPASPFTPAGEISSSILPYSIESSVYNQPQQQTASLTMPQFMTPPTDRPGYQPPKNEPTYTGEQFGPPQGPPKGSVPDVDPMSGRPMPNYPNTGDPVGTVGRGVRDILKNQSGVTGSMPEYGPPQPTPEQAAIKTLGETATKPITPTPPTPPAAGPAPPPPAAGPPPGPPAPASAAAPAAPENAPGPGRPAQPTPSPRTRIGRANELLDTPAVEVAKNLGVNLPPGSAFFMGQKTVRDLIKENPNMTGQFYPLLEKAGIDQDDLNAALSNGENVQPVTPAPTDRKARNPDAQAILDAAKELQMNPRVLGQMIWYETRFDPRSHNPTYSRHNPGEVGGLIGFDTANRIKYFGGPELSRVTGKTVAEQTPAIVKYMKERGWRPGEHDPNDVARAYSIINSGGLKNGEPNWGAADHNSRGVAHSLSYHLANITSARAQAATEKYLYGDATGEGGVGPTKVAQQGAQPPQGEPGVRTPPGERTGPPPAGGPTPTGPTTGYGPPPGYNPPGAFSKFFQAWGTNDPAAAYKTEMAKFGSYQAAANWDANNNFQYAGVSPEEGAQHLASHFEDTRKGLGVIEGGKQGQPGTIQHSNETGQNGPGGGHNEPVEGGQPPGPPATAGAPAATPSAPAPAMQPLPQDPVMSNIGRALASRNPDLVSKGLAWAQQAAAARHVGAEALLKELEAGPKSVSLVPGVGPVRWNPDGSANSLMTGRQAIPPRPGAPPMGAPMGAAPTMTPISSPYAGAPATPPPAGGAPTPLPTGAEPQPPPGGATPGADIRSDPAFTPRAQIPSSSRELAADPKAMEYAEDGRAWTDEGKKQISEEAKDAIKDARKHINADKQARVMLAQLREDLNSLPKSGPLSAGPLANKAAHLAGIYNNLARMAGNDEKGKPLVAQINPNAIGNIEQINKLSNTLAFALASTLGSREAVQIVNQARQSVPSADVSPAGSRKILEGLIAGLDFDQDYYSGMQKWSSANLFYSNSIKGYDDYFQETHPPDMYAMRGTALAARDANDNSITPEVMQALRQHPDRATAFDNHWGTPGLAQHIIKGGQ